MLADRDLSGALELLGNVAEEEDLPIPDLLDYLDFAVRRENAQAMP
jgi:hypothetical protein